MRWLPILVLLSACGGSDNLPGPTPPPPPPAQIAGAWSGTFESNYAPEAVFVDVTQVSATVTGTWLMTSGVRARGNISGTVDTANFTGTVTYNYEGGPTCQASFSGTASATSLMWSSPGFTGNCGLAAPGNPTGARFVLQRR